jgi:murein L,D-transpeptidase YafK
MRKKMLILVLCLVVFVLTAVFAVASISVAQKDVDKKSNDWGKSSLSEIHAVRSIIFKWINAWQSRDLAGYMSYYSPEFRSGKLDYHGWQVKKTKLFKRPGVIFLEISNLLIFIEGKEAKVSFLQDYTDAYLADVGEKNMKLIKLNDSWKIISEEWKPIKGN